VTSQQVVEEEATVAAYFLLHATGSNVVKYESLKLYMPAGLVVAQLLPIAPWSTLVRASNNLTWSTVCSAAALLAVCCCFVAQTSCSGSSILSGLRVRSGNCCSWRWRTSNAASTQQRTATQCQQDPAGEEAAAAAAANTSSATSASAALMMMMMMHYDHFTS
jgi:hypothetical protein